jgi:hypothetical protein
MVDLRDDNRAGALEKERVRQLDGGRRRSMLKMSSAAKEMPTQLIIPRQLSLINGTQKRHRKA